MPKVGNTQVLAGGTMSLSAKLTHCTTCAAASGVRPRSSSLLTAEAEHKGQNLGVVPTTIQSLKSPPLVHSSSSSSSCSPLTSRTSMPYLLQITIVGNGIALKHTKSIVAFKCWNLGTKQSKDQWNTQEFLTSQTQELNCFGQKRFYIRLMILPNETPDTIWNSGTKNICINVVSLVIWSHIINPKNLGIIGYLAKAFNQTSKRSEAKSYIYIYSTQNVMVLPTLHLSFSSQPGYFRKTCGARIPLIVDTWHICTEVSHNSFCLPQIQSTPVIF